MRFYTESIVLGAAILALPALGAPVANANSRVTNGESLPQDHEGSNHLSSHSKSQVPGQNVGNLPTHRYLSAPTLDTKIHHNEIFHGHGGVIPPLEAKSKHDETPKAGANTESHVKNTHGKPPIPEIQVNGHVPRVPEPSDFDSNSAHLARRKAPSKIGGIFSKLKSATSVVHGLDRAAQVGTAAAGLAATGVDLKQSYNQMNMPAGSYGGAGGYGAYPGAY